MKLFLILTCLLFMSCTRLQEKDALKTTDTTSTPLLNIETEMLLKKLFKLWDSKNSNLIEVELGKADNKTIVGSTIIYSYKAIFQTPYEQLIFETTNKSVIKSISHEFLDEKNETLNDQWLLNIVKNSEWKIVEITNKTHAVIPKKVLINYEKNIIAGYIDGYKNNQLRFIYFGTINEKKLDRFRWD